MHEVLLVKGDLDIAAVWAAPLRERGFSLLETDGFLKNPANPRRSNPPVAALVERVLPGGLDGLEIAVHMAGVLDLPVVLVVDGQDPDQVARAIRSGVDSCLAWPCEPEQVALTLRAAMVRKEVEREGRAELDRMARHLEETARRYQNMFHHSQAVNLLVDPETGDLVEANEAALVFYGYTGEEMSRLRIWDLNMLPREEVLRHMALATTRASVRFLFTHRLASGEMRRVMVYSGPVPYGDRTLLYSTVLDVSEREQAEEALMKSTADLERKARELQDMNAALRVLLAQRQRDREELEEQVLESVDALIRPTLDKLKEQCDDPVQERRLGVLERSLERIAAPFAQRLMARYRHLTPGEVRVADLVRGGRSNKEIAEVLNISVKTVEFHRANIRNKLGLTNQGMNLKTFLNSLA